MPRFTSSWPTTSSRRSTRSSARTSRQSSSRRGPEYHGGGRKTALIFYMSRLDAPGSLIGLWWRRLSRVPFGRALFSMMIGRMVPYTGSIGARCEELSPGTSRWTLKDRRKVRNHLHSIHAVALVNLAEVSSGSAMLTALGPGIRGIVTGLEITYLKKARGTLTATGRSTVPEVDGKTAVDAYAEITDTSGDVVARAVVHWQLERHA